MCDRSELPKDLTLGRAQDCQNGVTSKQQRLLLEPLDEALGIVHSGAGLTPILDTSRATCRLPLCRARAEQREAISTCSHGTDRARFVAAIALTRAGTG